MKEIRGLLIKVELPENIQRMFKEDGPKTKLFLRAFTTFFAVWFELIIVSYICEILYLIFTN